jgi:hypothetical protein
MDEWKLVKRADGDIQLTLVNACFRDDLLGVDDNPYDDADMALSIDDAVRMRNKLTELIGD